MDVGDRDNRCRTMRNGNKLARALEIAGIPLLFAAFDNSPPLSETVETGPRLLHLAEEPVTGIDRVERSDGAREPTSPAKIRNSFLNASGTRSAEHVRVARAAVPS